MRKCVAITRDNKKCVLNGEFNGYCVKHFVKYNYNKYQKLRLVKWKEQRMMD